MHEALLSRRPHSASFNCQFVVMVWIWWVYIPFLSVFKFSCHPIRKLFIIVNSVSGISAIWRQRSGALCAVSKLQASFRNPMWLRRRVTQVTSHFQVLIEVILLFSVVPSGNVIDILRVSIDSFGIHSNLLFIIIQSFDTMCTEILTVFSNKLIDKRLEFVSLSEV
jgi:hypothetical protein